MVNNSGTAATATAAFPRKTLRGVLYLLFLGGWALILVGFSFLTGTATQLLIGPQFILGGIIALIAGLVVMGIHSR